jgi:deferrochelatase/peroxidase EfeB
MTEPAGLGRRRFLAGLAAAGSLPVVGACAADPTDRGASAGAGAGEGAGEGEGRAGEAAAGRAAAYLPFEGVHQTGITSHVPAAGLAAAFDVVGVDRDGLAEALQALTGEIRSIMGGHPYEERDPAYPPVHAGTLGNSPPPADLSVVVAVGASLFDDRFGLAEHRPRHLERMPFLANDRLDESLSHGDLLLTISGDSADATLFALRQLMRRTRSSLVLRWMVEGFNRRERPAPGQAPVRNLMGFKDGTANLDAADDEVMDRFVWVGDGDGEPAWATGGSYQVVRTIRMFVEFWDRTPLGEQEALIGRHKESGAPLGGQHETDAVDFDDDPDGDVTPLDAHIRLANPRTAETEGSRILRRGFSYSRGFDAAGQLDQGLCFVCFQRDLRAGFLAVQERLSGEPLEEYILPVGGGFFYALPGVEDGDGWLGQGLLEAPPA